jgi:hypothetical protein
MIRDQPLPDGEPLVEKLDRAEAFLRAQGGDDLYDLADAVADARQIVEAAG